MIERMNGVEDFQDVALLPYSQSRQRYVRVAVVVAIPAEVANLESVRQRWHGCGKGNN